MNSIILGVTLISLILLAIPIPIAMGISCLVVFLVGGYPLYIIPQKLIATASRWTLLALPFFILAGSLMNELQLTDRLFKFARLFVGHIKGGLAHVNVLASMIFAGISGSATADIAGLGKIEIKAMTDAGFSKAVSAGITVASSVVGPIIPPSVAFILYGVIAEVSIARLFLAGLFPGILIGISLMITTYFQAIKRPDQFPTEKRAKLSEFPGTFKSAILAVFAPILILLGMTTGIISPTEAGAGAAIYSMFVGVIYKTISWKIIWKTMKIAMLQSSYAMLLVALASVMGYIITFERTPQLIIAAFGGMVTSPWSVLLFCNIIFLIIGLFMSATASLILLTPILLPIVIEAGIDPVHFGVIISFALHIGIATPPVGMGLFIITEIADISFNEAVKATLPYLFPLVVSLFIITYFPAISLWLPNLLLN